MRQGSGQLTELTLSTRRRCALLVGLALLALPAMLALADEAPLTSPAEQSSEATTPEATPAAAATSATPDVFVAETLRPFTLKFCGECHAGDEPESGLRLDQAADFAAVLRDRDTWEKALENLLSGAMPPAGHTRPTDEEAQQIIDALFKRFDEVDAAAPPNPGRTTIRRLNRVEYRNTIRDLIGIDYAPVEDFPTDDVGYGFDNIGDVLTLPPVLLEKYLAAAEQIAQQAILTTPPAPAITRHEAEALKAANGQAYDDGFWILPSTGEVGVSFDVTKAGDYQVRIRAYGAQAGDEPARMGLVLDDQQIERFDVTARSGEPEVYEHRLSLGVGKHRLAASFLNDYWNPDHEDPEQRDRNLLVDYLEVEGPLGVALEYPEMHRRIIFCPPAADASRDAQLDAARQIVRRLATRAYRRPATDDEVERLAGFVRRALEAGDSFEAGVQLALQAVLVSPHFLFRVELDDLVRVDIDDRTHNGAPAQAINEFELATRLSYFLWNTMPDEELFSLAERGALRAPGELEKQIRRMLADAKSRALVEQFAAQWLHLRSLEIVSPNPKQFPAFDPDLREAMRRETEECFAYLIREDRSVLELLDADYTFVNQRLAGHYGIEGVKGEEFRKVSTAGTPRGGLLTQASILTVTSNPTRTSPVKRGRWVLEQLLGAPPPPPPPDVPELKEQAVDTAASLRERMEQHRANVSCAACHARMDPLGFGLENFDAIGAWREQDGDAPIDASGTLPAGDSFQGPVELKSVLKNHAGQFRRCLAEKMLTYAIGRGVERYDRRAVAGITAAMEADGDKFSRLVLAIVDSQPFQMRRAQGAKP
ncbi:MAG: DUF1592 domain-containing protein [Pirellulales bacterium]